MTAATRFGATACAALAVALTFTSACARAAAPASVPPPPQGSGGSVEYGKFHSESLGTDVAYAVSLPPSYKSDTSKHYPVVIFLHGLFNNEKDWEGRGIEAKLEALRASGKIGEFVVAVPYGANSFYLNGKDGTRYEDAIVKDFIPFVDKTYRTTATPKERVIEGISMGGYGALEIAFKHPELFTAVAAHSAALFEELPKPPAAGDQRGSYRYQMATQIFGTPPDPTFFAANNPLDLGAANAEKIKGLKIYFDVGEQDRYGFAPGNARLDAILTKAGVAHEYHAVPGDHGWAFLLGRAEPAFTFVWQCLKPQ